MYKQNNADQMKTVVETFLIEEVESLIYDNDNLQEWHSKIEELGLEGQRKVAVPEKSPIPFLAMNTNLVAVFETLCPSRHGIEDFSITPIPLEILTLVGLAKREGYFNSIEVWCDDKNPDPAVIGMRGYWYEPTWYTNSDKSLNNREFESKELAVVAGANNPTFNRANLYLIGKWGDVKHSIAELKAMAKQRFVAERSNEFNRQIKEAKRGLDDIETDAFKRFGV